MNDRLFTFLCAFGAFALFYGFFIGNATRNDEDGPSRPLSAESRPNGYRALSDWLASARIAQESMRHRYDWLLDPASGLKRSGNVLIVTLPGVRPARNRETADLVDWVRQGNTLVIAAGLFDTPEWSPPGMHVLEDLQRMARLQFTVYQPETDPGAATPATDEKDEDHGPGEPSQVPRALAGMVRLPQPKASRMQARGVHPLTRGVDSVSAVSEYPSDQFTTASPKGGAVLELMDDVETGLPALWVSPLGAGTVVVSAYGSVFTNKMLGRADNARLFANLLAWRLAPGGVVLFDDMHQGASSFYDAGAFFADPRLHATFWWIIGLWLVWVMLGTRLRARPPRVAQLREGSFVRSIGNLLARALPAGAVGERMCAHLFDDIRRKLGWPANGEPVWEWFRTLSGLPPGEVALLADLHARLDAGRRVDLVRLQNLILSIRKQLL